MELLKLLSTNEIVSQVICFLLLLFILRAALWKRFLKVLDDRKERIASEFRSIEAAKLAAEETKASYEIRMAAIEEEARSKIQDAIQSGKRIAEEIREKAEKYGEKVLENAKDNIRIELAKAKEDLKYKIVDLTISVAERVIQEKLSGEEEKRLVEDFLKGIEPK